MQLNEFSKTVTKAMDDQGLSDIIGGSSATVAGCEQIAEAVLHLTLLQPDMDILDFGCGCGRLALPMLQYLSEQGSYTGIDIVPRLIQFCTSHISPNYRNCRFFLSPDSNVLYEQYRQDSASELAILENLEELGTEKFDVIAAFSVFTHLTDSQAASYLERFRPLLKPNGQVLISCFLLNDASRGYLEQGKSTIAFGPEAQESRDVYYVDDVLTAVGYEEHRLQRMAQEAGFEPVVTYHGHWCGRPIRHSYQDIVVLSKQPELPKSFDPHRYLELNPDLDITGVHDQKAAAEQHYLQYGISEGRKW